MNLTILKINYSLGMLHAQQGQLQPRFASICGRSVECVQVIPKR